MNIAFVNWWTFNTVMGGIEAVGARVAQALVARGHSLCFATVEEGYPSIEGILNMLFPDRKHIRSRVNKDALVSYFSAHEVEVVVCHNAYRHSLALLLREVADELRLPLAFELHNDPALFRYKRRFPRLFHPLEYCFRKNKSLRQWRLLAEVGDAVVLLSPSYISQFRDLAGLESINKLFYIPNPNSFAPEEIPKELPKSSLVLYVGRFDYGQKRTDRLLRVWQRIQSRHPDWSLALVGGGGDRDVSDLRQLARELSLDRVSFEGVQSPRLYLERASILASTSSYEGLPLVMLEALQYGVVPIAFDSYAALGDLTDGGKYGVRIHPFDLSAYADALSALMDDTELRERMSRGGRKWSHRYDMDQVVKLWEDFLNQLIHKKT